MKYFLLLCALHLTSLSNPALTVTFSGFEKVKGQLYIRIKNEKQQVVVEKVVPVTAKTLTVNFTDLKPGKYAISAFQDLNNNGKIDIGMFGPTEPYGYSNNARGIFSEPDFSAQLFDLKDATKTSITLK
jgi:uncharacterized protein (DUF2141 family)